MSGYEIRALQSTDFEVIMSLEDREVYCTILSVAPAYQGTRVAQLMLREFLNAIVGQVDTCWFTVKWDNEQARARSPNVGGGGYCRSDRLLSC